VTEIKLSQQRGDEGPVTTKPCAVCGEPVPPKSRKGGHPRIYCSNGCRYRAAADRKSTGSGARPRARSRRPLPEFARDAGWTLRSDVERLERVFADDRFGASKQQVAAFVRGHLKYAAEVCQDLLSRLDETTGR
jgi:hypothetical protein